MECVPSSTSSGCAHQAVRVLQREAGPDQGHEGKRQERVLHALERQHAQVPVGAGGRRGRQGAALDGPPLEAQADQFANPVAALVEQHQADGHRDQQQVKLPHPAQHRRFGAALGDVHLADGETRTGAGMALAAGLRQVLGIDGGIGVGRRQNVVYAVATGAIGHGLRAGLGGQAVVRRIEAHQAVRRQPELARQPDVAVATAAGVANVRRRSPGKPRWYV